MAREILTRWKEIEAYVGLRRATIIALGYPVRKHTEHGSVFALRDELLAHAMQPLKTAQNDTPNTPLA